MLAQRDIAELVSEPNVKPVISRRQVSRALRFARPLLLEHLGEDDVIAVERQLLHEYAEVAPAVPLLHSPVSRMTLRIVRFLVAQGAPEPAPIMCRGDYQIAKYLPPDVTFERTQVIAEGAPYCDFRYLLRNTRDPRIDVSRDRS